MIICKVTGKVISTIKNEALVGTSLITVNPIVIGAKGEEQISDEVIVAADPIGCGKGNKVLVARGSNARYAISGDRAPVDAAIVGIID